MTKLVVHAGDFPQGNASISFILGICSISFPWQPGDGVLGQSLSLTALTIAELEVASEEAVKRLGGAIGWGVIGGALFGPVGLLAGLLGGGKRKDVTFVLRLKDGRKLLGSTDSKMFTKLKALAF